jgi:hypothetical protein
MKSHDLRAARKSFVRGQGLPGEAEIGRKFGIDFKSDKILDFGRVIKSCT